MILNKVLYAAVIVFFSVSVTFAQPAIVKSGEHGTFSRLTISADTLGTWTTEHAANKRRIRFTSFVRGFDISEVFTRIDHNRIKSILVQNSTLEIELSCLCEIKIFENGPNMVVIDIKEQQPLAVAFRAPHNFDLSYFGKTHHFSFTRHPVFSMKPSSKLTAPLQYPENPHLTSPPSERARVSTRFQEQSTLNVREESLTNTSEIILENLQTQLINGFGAASTRGILDLYITPFDRQVDSPASPTPGLKSVNGEQETTGNFSIETSLQTPSIRKGISYREDFDLKCKPDQRFNLVSWSDGRPFDQQLGDANVNLFTTLEKLDIGAAVKLARLYLFFGFGAEAKQITNLNDMLQKRWPELSAIADILENRSVTEIRHFATKNDCKGPILLWEFIARNGLNSHVPTNNRAILLELSSLPIHLRQILVPKVSARFLEVGNPVFAKSALQTLKRTEYALAEKAGFEEASILLATNKPEAAFEAFSAIKSNSQIAAEALVQKTQLQLDANLEISEITQELIESYATEYQGTPIGLKLREVAILATSKTGGFAQAFAKIALLDDGDQPPLLRQVYNDIINFSGDASFVRHSFIDVDKTLLGDSDKLPLQFAKRLLKLGFYEEAKEYLSFSSADFPSDEFNLVGAKILIALDRPAAAFTLLNNVTGNDAKLLLAQVFTMQGKRKKAHEIYKGLDANEQEMLNAWLSADWQDKFGGRGGLVNQLAQVTQSPVAPIDLADGMLSQIEELLDESRESRGVMSKIFATPELDLQQK
jgi:hypothetical protein